MRGESRRCMLASILAKYIVRFDSSLDSGNEPDNHLDTVAQALMVLLSGGDGGDGGVVALQCYVLA